MTSFIVPTLEGVLLFTVAGFAISRLMRRNDVADGIWGLGFLGVAGFHLLARPDALAGFRARLVLALVTLWALRLSLYLWIRLLGKKEDERYNNWRREWGKREPVRAFLQIFLLQGVLMGLIATPIALVMHATPEPVGGLALAGTFVFLVGFLFETVADAQMYRFKKKRANAGKLMTQGLWSLSRHPNYFGEILVWWGIFLIVLEIRGVPAIALLSPLLITYLLVRVSGVPMLDRLLKERGAGFEKYARSTPALIPRLWPKD